MKRQSKPPGPPADPPVPPSPDRRHNRPLREVLDELVAHVRDIARRAPHMSPAELEYAQERLEWLADEVWRLAVRGEESRVR
jgi:hypothetical protein